MGQGGHLTLVNGTRYDWTLTVPKEPYQMNSFRFPETVPAMKSADVYIEWNEGLWARWQDDSGEVVYTLRGSKHSFEIQARVIDERYHLQVAFTNLETQGNPRDSTIDLGWNWDSYVTFVLAGSEGDFISTNPPAAWMQNNLSTLGKLPLKHLCMPGTHDAGMWMVDGGTAFAGKTTTITQTRSIGGQLLAGSRFFDIRPVISAGAFKTGHYNEMGTWQGTNGQSIASIIDDVNAFTSTHKELVILYLSHDLNTDSGYGPLTQEDWNRLLSQLQNIKDLYIAPSPPDDLTKIALADYIGTGAAVVVVVDRSDIALGKFANNGFYTKKQFSVFDSYAGKSSVEEMASDQ